MATDLDPVTLSDFLAALPQKRRESQPSASKAAPEPKEEMSDLLEQFPWLVDYLDEGLAKPTERPKQPLLPPLNCLLKLGS